MLTTNLISGLGLQRTYVHDYVCSLSNHTLLLETFQLEQLLSTFTIGKSAGRRKAIMKEEAKNKGKCRGQGVVELQIETGVYSTFDQS